MPVDDPHRHAEAVDRLIDGGLESDGLNQEVLEEYIFAAEGTRRAGTIVNTVGKAETVLARLEGDFEEVSATDISREIRRLAGERDWSDGTRRNYEKAFRAIIREVNENSEREFDFPDRDAISLTETSSGEGQITKEDVLSRDQITTLIEDASRNERDRMMFGLLADLGLRIGALCSLRVGDFVYDETSGLGEIRLNENAEGTKGAEGRTQVTTWSTPYIKRYLDSDHPRPEDDDAPLLHKHKWNNGDRDDDGSFTPPVVRRRIKRVAEDTDIPDDQLNPHNFRHTAVTLWALRGLSDREIEHRAGWARESGQLDRYEHLTDDDINDEILDKFGISRSDEAIPEVESCPQCGISVEPAMSYCGNCGQQLTSEHDYPDWLDDYRSVFGKDDELYQHLRDNPHELSRDVQDLPQRIYSSLVENVQEEIESAGVTEDGLSDLRDELRDDLSIDYPEIGPTPTIVYELESETIKFEISPERWNDIEDDVADLQMVTDTEMVLLDEDGKGLEVVSLLEPRDDYEE